MKKKQTAVEWLEERFQKYTDWIEGDAKATEYTLTQLCNDFAKAKEMEKEQMIEFARAFWYYAYGADAPPVYPEDVEKFYKKVFEV